MEVIAAVGGCSLSVLEPFLLTLSLPSFAGQVSATKAVAAFVAVVDLMEVRVVSALLFEALLLLFEVEEGVATAVSVGRVGVGSGTTDAEVVAMEERAVDLFFRGTTSSTVTTSTSELFMSRSMSSCCFCCCFCCFC